MRRSKPANERGGDHARGGWASGCRARGVARTRRADAPQARARVARLSSVSAGPAASSASAARLTSAPGSALPVPRSADRIHGRGRPSLPATTRGALPWFRLHNVAPLPKVRFGGYRAPVPDKVAAHREESRLMRGRCVIDTAPYQTEFASMIYATALAARDGRYPALCVRCRSLIR